MSTVSPDLVKHALGNHDVGAGPKASSTGPKLTLVETPVSEPLTASVRELVSTPASHVSEWFDASSPQGVRVSIVAGDGSRCWGTAVVSRAEESRFGVLAGVSDADLARTVTLSDIALDPAHADEALPAVLYLALRRARIWERATVAAYVEPGARGAQLLGLERLARLPSAGARIPVGQRLDVATHYAYRATSKEMQVFLQRHFVPEVVETLDRWLKGFLDSPWFRAVHEGTLTREQYIFTLANLHQFVRYTTRIIGRAVGFSDDRALRNHWLNHLEGEINHELIIEKDLANLGADVDYVVGPMVPQVQNMQFMVTQESMIAFYNDPVMLMAAPFVAEGYTGHLDEKFMNDLERVAKSWGIEKPAHVTRFFSSHIEYDGGKDAHGGHPGQDGHWGRIVSMLERHLVDDAKLRRFLNVVHLAKNATEQSYNSYVNDLALFSASPTPMT
jgi:hypothetical protein